jgi:hypothetical protein
MLLVGAIMGASWGAAPAPAAGSGEDSRRGRETPLEKSLAIQVKAAPLHAVVAEMADASGVKMRLGRALLPATEPGPGDQRVTLYAPRASVAQFQRAVATLLRLRWTRAELPAEPALGVRGLGADAGGREPRAASHEPSYRYTLEAEPRARAQVQALRERQAARFLERLLETAVAMTSPATATAHAAALREAFQIRHPQFPERRLEELDVEFLRQSLLVAPLDGLLRARLAHSRSLSLPLTWLNDPSAALLASFALGEPGGQEAGLIRDPRSLVLPAARAQYRLLYGDRWTDTLLRVRVGTVEDGRTAWLPSILYREEDGATLYPESRAQPNDAAIWRRLPADFSMTGRNWEEDLLKVARAMKIRVASDAYPRPSLFDIPSERPALAGVPLGDALDRLCQAYGMFWWKQGDWHYFRHRTWPEEERVDLPERFLRRFRESVREEGRLSPDDLLVLGSLEDEQLMTLGLRASRTSGSGEAAPAAGATAPYRALDVEGAGLAAASLIFYRALAPAQRELAESAGLPALWLTPIQQQLFASVAAELGYSPSMESLPGWGFVIEQQFPPAGEGRAPTGGRIRFHWHFGQGLQRTATVAIPVG